MRFEWDENKRRENLQKHAIDLADVPEMFALPVLAELDDRMDYGEDRWIGIGFLRFRVVVVVYTVTEDSVRIISARKALNHEERRYREYLEDRLGPPRRDEG